MSKIIDEIGKLVELSDEEKELLSVKGIPIKMENVKKYQEAIKIAKELFENVTYTDIKEENFCHSIEIETDGILFDGPRKKKWVKLLSLSDGIDSSPFIDKKGLGICLNFYLYEK